MLRNKQWVHCHRTRTKSALVIVRHQLITSFSTCDKTSSISVYCLHIIYFKLIAKDRHQCCFHTTENRIDSCWQINYQCTRLHTHTHTMIRYISNEDKKKWKNLGIRERTCKRYLHIFFRDVYLFKAELYTHQFSFAGTGMERHASSTALFLSFIYFGWFDVRAPFASSFNSSTLVIYNLNDRTLHIPHSNRIVNTYM